MDFLTAIASIGVVEQLAIGTILGIFLGLMTLFWIIKTANENGSDSSLRMADRSVAIETIAVIKKSKKEPRKTIDGYYTKEEIKKIIAEHSG